MGSNLVIVALPADDDPVWKISSEEKPHLTMLFLGDAESNPNVERIVEFVQHAANVSEHGPFYMDIDHRGTLGPDEADVLFFRKGWSAKWITSLRGQLLQNTDIKSAYDSTTQYDEWTPHLTLGYPETPANEDKMPEHGLHGVRFDRIAVWVQDFDGPEIRLEWPEDDWADTVAWSEKTERARQFAHALVLEQSGVKGMKWGVRKDTQVTVGGKQKMVTAKKATKLDKKFEKKVGSTDTFVELHNKAADHVNAGLPAFNARFDKKYPKEMKDGTLWNESHPVTKEYTKAYNDMFVAGLNKAASAMGTNPTGTRKVRIVSENHDNMSEFGWSWGTTDKIKHAATDSQPLDDLVFVAKRDKNGVITNVTMDKMIHTDPAAEFLEHFGVKGMKWGVRKESVASGAKAAGKAVVKGAKRANRAIGDASFESRVDSGHARDAVELAGHKAFHKEDLPKINAKSEYQAAKKLTHRLTNPKDPLTKQYRGEVKQAYINRLEKTANSMKNPSGTRQYTIRERGIDLPAKGGKLPTSKYVWDVTARNIKHAADGETTTTLEVVMDKDGFITDLKPVPASDSMAQSAITAEEFVNELMHFGVKGMRWGVHRDRPAPTASTPTAVSRVPHGEKRKTKIDVQGGSNHPAHEDAIKVAEAKVKLQRSGVHALSNKELRDVRERVQLEEQVQGLMTSRGRKFVRNQLQVEGQNLARAGARAGVKKGVKKAGPHVIRKAAAVGATAALI